MRSNANCANKSKPSEYFKAQILVDTMVFSDEGLRHLVAEMGVGQVVYGTDMPFNWPVTVDLVLNAPFLSDAEKEAILGGNLMKLLRIRSVRWPCSNGHLISKCQSPNLVECNHVIHRPDRFNEQGGAGPETCHRERRQLKGRLRAVHVT